MPDPVRVDHVAQGRDLMPGQWDTNVSVQGFLESWLQQTQVIEDLAIDVNQSFNVFTAVGRQLDFLGSVKAVDRLGRDDDTYRAAILVSIAATSGSGTVQDLSSTLMNSAGGTITKIFEYFPLSVVGYVNTAPSIPATEAFSRASVGGVQSDHVMFDDNRTSAAFPSEQASLSDVVTHEGDNVVDHNNDNVQAYVGSGVNDPLGIGGFSDESESFADRRPLPTLIVSGG